MPTHCIEQAPVPPPSYYRAQAQHARALHIDALTLIQSLHPAFVVPLGRAIGASALSAALRELKAAGANPSSCELRQSKYLNNVIEQDHRFIKRLTKPGMGFFRFETAWRTLQGYETMNMFRKGQIQGVGTRDSVRQAMFIAERFGVAI
jgi:hypothetical protein